MGNFLSAYDTGLTFSNAFFILYRKHLDGRIDFNPALLSLFIPMLANGAFACELFLKELLGGQVRGHKLYSDLYQKLDLQTAEEIKSITIAVLHAKHIEMSPEKFLLELQNMERTFEELRYIHEIESEKTYNIDFIEALVVTLRELCKQRSEKRSLST